MASKHVSTKNRQALDEVLGYLNFSTGAADRQFLFNLNGLFRDLAVDEAGGQELPNCVAALLQKRLDELSRQGGTFANVTQAKRAIELLTQNVLPGYRTFHRDLLLHQDEETLFGPLFCGRVFEVILQEITTSTADASPEAVSAAVIARLNDYVGHRPLATLETRQTEPYPHEWHRPVPLWIRGVGAAPGRYETLLTRAVEILEAADADLLSAADFDPRQMEELAMDARGYDFDHPANKRPNYHFGHWDPHCIDSRGHYRRYVVRQEILDALTARVEQGQAAEAEGLMFESAAALAGTMLMSAELTGSGPTAHTSDATLGTLMPRIAAHRDRFYEELIRRSGRERGRLQAEARQRRQPFGGVRQYLNADLARRRAAQLEHVHLARLLARIGQTEAAQGQAAAVSTARARMVCQMQCLLASADRSLDQGDLESAATLAAKTIELLHRAIQCGAVVDPWNLLGCDAQFPLFPALENSVYDHRVDELLEVMAEILQVLARGWTLAAAAGQDQSRQRIQEEMTSLAAWWDQFASTSVSSVEGIDAGSLREAAAAVADALSAWHRGGTTAGDIAFWRPFVARFDSPKAFVLVVEALLDRGDFVASMALLMQWLSEADRVPLQEVDASFHAMAGRWLRELFSGPAAAPLSSQQQWRLVTRFFDSIEANAEQWGQAPTLEMAQREPAAGPSGSELLDDLPAGVEEERDDEEEDELFAAAYDGMVYRDSTDDGVSEDLLGAPGEGKATDHELEHESRRVSARLAFLVTLATLWRYTAEQVVAGKLREPDAPERLAGWAEQLQRLHKQLGDLLTAAARLPIPRPSGSSESLLQYDRLRTVKDALLEQVIAAAARCKEAEWMVIAAGGGEPKDVKARTAARVLAALIRADAAAVRQVWSEMLEDLSGQPLLYVPLAKGGDPHKILAARSFQRLVRLLLGLLPRVGLLVETGELLHAAGEWERQQGASAGSVTEYDDLVKIANQAMAECIVASHAGGPAVASRDPDSRQAARQRQHESAASVEHRDASLIDDLDALVRSLLPDWLRHSRNLRLSVLEKVLSEPRWQQLVDLIQRYGSDLFVQQFLHMGHLRAILHRGVEGWVEDVDEQDSDYRHLRLVEAIREGTAPKRAIELLQLVLEAIVENYVEYRDYNSTTTQSDRGDLIYMLLDLLRLRVQYDRIDWNVAPIVQVHEVLLRHGRASAAALWRTELAQRTDTLADDLQARLEELQRNYGMRLPTVADRIRERFVRPLLVDRAQALLRGAIGEVRGGEPGAACTEFQQELEELSREPTGVGLDVPQWLETLENEAERILAEDPRYGLAESAVPGVPQRTLSRDEIREQLERMERTEE